MECSRVMTTSRDLKKFQKRCVEEDAEESEISKCERVAAHCILGESYEISVKSILDVGNPKSPGDIKSREVELGSHSWMV